MFPSWLERLNDWCWICESFSVWVCLVNLRDISLFVFLCIVSSLLSASSFGMFVRPNHLALWWVFLDESRFQRSVWIFIPVHDFISLFIFFLAFGWVLFEYQRS